jgi:outer membrane protein assembly factor BamB
LQPAGRFLPAGCRIPGTATLPTRRRTRAETSSLFKERIVNKALRSVLLMLCLLLALAGCGRPAKPEAIWQLEIIEDLSSPAIDGSMAYISSDKGHLFALDLDQRDLRWRFDAGDELGPPAVVDGVVYVGGQDRNLYALDAATGKELWRFAAQAELTTIPTLDTDTVYIGAADGRLYALDRASGAERWQMQLSGELHNYAHAPMQQHLILANGLLYVSTQDEPSSHLYAIDPQTQRIVWSIDTNLSFISAPAVDERNVYVGTYGALRAFDAKTGAYAWHRWTNAEFGTPLVAGGRVYVGAASTSQSGKDASGLYAVDPATGEIIWQYATSSPIFARPLLVGDRVYAVSLTHGYSLDVAVGKPVRILEYIQPNGSQPALAQGRVLVGSGWGKIYEFKP